MYSFCLEKPSMATTEKSLAYSNKEIGCKGRACATCGNCRDWYWHPEGDDYKTYTKRTDASCTAPDHSYRCRYYAYFTGGRTIYWHYLLEDGKVIGVVHMCECENNQ
jgi:hypothetical protein